MDLETAIIGIICVALCAMPFILTNRSRRKREVQLLKSIKELAEQQNSEITQYEIGNNYLVAIDDVKNLLFFQFNAKEELKQLFVDLSSIKNCHLRKKNTSSDTIERLDLELIPNNMNNSAIVLNFFRIDISYQLNGELESIRHWNELVNKKLVELRS